MRKTNSSNAVNENSILENCPITSTWQAIGGRWKLVLLWQLKEGPMRYNELFRAIPNISQKMLTQQLKSLVEEGWVHKTDFKEIPPRTEYRLSVLGSSFVPILQNIHDWGEKNHIADKYSIKPSKK